MRLAILSDDGENLYEYGTEEVRKRLRMLLETTSFDEAWDTLEKELKRLTGRL